MFIGAAQIGRISEKSGSIKSFKTIRETLLNDRVHKIATFLFPFNVTYLPTRVSQYSSAKNVDSSLFHVH